MDKEAEDIALHNWTVVVGNIKIFVAARTKIGASFAALFEIERSMKILQTD